MQLWADENLPLFRIRRGCIQKAVRISDKPLTICISPKKLLHSVSEGLNTVLYKIPPGKLHQNQHIRPSLYWP